MNVAQLFHKYQGDPSELVPHSPTFTLTEQTGQNWYFFSERTLRKKTENVSLAEFLNKSEDYCLLVIKFMDCRKFTNSDYPISVQKVPKGKVLQFKANAQGKEPGQLTNEEKTVIKNNWRAKDYQKTVIIRVDEPEQNQIYTLFWSKNIVRCSAPITQHMRDKLTDYGELIGSTFASRYTSTEIQELELVFSYNKEEGKIKALFAHNMRLSTACQTIQSQRAFLTDFKTGEDEYEKLELQLQIQNNSRTEDYYEVKRIQYLNLLKKINTKKETDFSQRISMDNFCSTKRQFQCGACHCHVMIESDSKTTERVITANRIPEIQMLRQVKMKSAENVVNYDLISVCQLCYDKYLEVCAKREVPRTGRPKRRLDKSRTTIQKDRPSSQQSSQFCRNKVNSVSKPLNQEKQRTIKAGTIDTMPPPELSAFTRIPYIPNRKAIKSSAHVRKQIKDLYRNSKTRQNSNFVNSSLHSASRVSNKPELSSNQTENSLAIALAEYDEFSCHPLQSKKRTKRIIE